MTRAPALSFTVRGLPGAQGSKSFKGLTNTGRAILAESSEKVKPWRQDVVVCALEAQRALPGRWVPIADPVHLVIEFFLPRPKTHPKTKRTVPAVAPDVDKLARSTLDGLKSAGVYRDDALVTDLTVRKRYAVQDDALGHAWELPAQGAVISVFRLEPEETWADRPLDHVVASQLPARTLPSNELIDYAMHTAATPEPTESDVWIAPDATDSQAAREVGKALAMVERRTAMTPAKRAAQPAVTVWVGDGLSRLASWPGQPMTALQRSVSALLTDGPAVGVTVRLVTSEGVVSPSAA